MNRTLKPLLRIGVAAAFGALLGGVGRTSRVVRDLKHNAVFTPAMWISIGLWFAFSIYWSVAARDKAPTRSGESILSRQFHVFAVNVALLILVFPVPGLLQQILPASPALQAAGLAIQAAFIGLAIWARRFLGSNWSGEVRIASGHELVRSGPYAYVRHPIYTALVGMYIGTCLVSGQLHGPVALGIMLLAYSRKIRMEERALAEAFPDDHERYRETTWAWIPGVY